MLNIAFFTKILSESRIKFFIDELIYLDKDFFHIFTSDPNQPRFFDQFNIKYTVSYQAKSSVFLTANKYFSAKPKENQTYAEICETKSFDIFEAWGSASLPEAYYYAKKYNKPLILRVLDKQDIDDLIFILKYNKINFFSHINLIFTTSHILKWSIVEIGGIVNKIQVIPPFLNTAFFNKITSDKIKQHPIITIQNSFASGKKLFFILNALAKILKTGYDFEIILLKSNTDESDYLKWVNYFEIQNNFNAFSSDIFNQISTLKKSFLTIIPTINSTNKTNALRASMESSICKLPVLTAPMEYHTNFIEDGVTGYFIREKDVDSIYEHITYLFRNPAEKEKMGISAYAKMDFEFNANKLTNKFLKTIELIL